MQRTFRRAVNLNGDHCQQQRSASAGPKGTMSTTKSAKRANRRAAPRGSAAAFRKWRGKRPTGGYGYDRMKWDYEDCDMRLAWDAAVAWAMMQNKEVRP